MIICEPAELQLLLCESPFHLFHKFPCSQVFPNPGDVRYHESMLLLFMSTFFAFSGTSSPPSSSISRLRFLDVSWGTAVVGFSVGASGRVNSGGATALVSVAAISTASAAGG